MSTSLSPFVDLLFTCSGEFICRTNLSTCLHEMKTALHIPMQTHSSRCTSAFPVVCSVCRQICLFMHTCVCEACRRTSADICFCVCDLCVPMHTSVFVCLHERTCTHLSCKGTFSVLIPQRGAQCTYSNAHEVVSWVCRFMWARRFNSPCVWILVTVAGSCTVEDSSVSLSRTVSGGGAAGQQRLPTTHKSLTGSEPPWALVGASWELRRLLDTWNHLRGGCSLSDSPPEALSQLLPQYLMASRFRLVTATHNHSEMQSSLTPAQ